MGKTHRYNRDDDDRNLLVSDLDVTSEDLMRAELQLDGVPEPGTKFYAITDHLGSVLDDIESQPGNGQAEADAERQAIFNASQALGALVDAEYGDDLADGASDDWSGNL